MSKILEALVQAKKAAAIAQDQVGRQMASLFGAATNNADPEQQRRIKTTTEAKGGLTEMDWAMRVLPTPYWDPPLPTPGMSVPVGCFDGNPHDAQYAGVMVNRVNPPMPKADPVNDDWRRVPGIQTLQIGGDRLTEIVGEETRDIGRSQSITVGQNYSLRADKDGVIDVGDTLTLRNDAGASLTLTEDGFIVLADAFGHTITLSGGLNGTGVRWNLGGDALNIINAGNVTINDRSVIVVGSTDTDNDVNNDRGY